MRDAALLADKLARASCYFSLFCKCNNRGTIDLEVQNFTIYLVYDHTGGVL